MLLFELWRATQRHFADTGRRAFITTFRYQNGIHRIGLLVGGNPPHPHFVLSLGTDPATIREFETRLYRRHDVIRAYDVNPYLGTDYGDFRAALGIPEGQPGAPRWSPETIFESLEQQIPHLRLHTYNIEQARQFIDPRTVEEAAKIYFMGWMAWGPGQGPSAKNLAKSELLLGSQVPNIRQISIDTNASTAWTADPTKAKGFYLPR